MSRIRAVVMSVLAVGVVAGCQEGGDDGIGVDATGTVMGLAWVDRNGNGTLEGADGPAPDVRVQLVTRTGSTALYTTTTDVAGEFLLSPVLVGDYVARVDSGSVGDTLEVLRVDSATMTVAADDTATVLVALTYPNVTTDSARMVEPGRRLFVEGLALGDWDTYRDQAIHVRDSTGAIRVLRVQATAARAGDSVRVLATTDRQAGRAVLRDGTVFILSTGLDSPDPVAVITGAAADAGGGELDAELVRVTGATVQDTLRNSFAELILRVDDGSGALDIVLDRDIPFLDPGVELIGATADATGLLVPPASGIAGTWVLKPRSNADLTVR